MIKKKSVWSILMVLVLMLFAGCEKNPREEIHGFEKWTLVREAYMIFPDGVHVQEWTNEDKTQTRFQIAEEEALLEVTCRISFLPETDKKGLTGIVGMSLIAQKAVELHYQEQNKEFDIDPFLKSAYQDYRNCRDTEEHFTTHTVLREVMPAAENERYVAFLTALTVPKQDHFNGDTVCVYDERFFDREDGTQIDLNTLFLPEQWEQVLEELSALCAEDDTTVTDDDIYATIDQADILIFQDYLEVWFPYGTWEKQEFDKGFGIKYERIPGLLQEWAIPAEEPEKGE